MNRSHNFVMTVLIPIALMVAAIAWMYEPSAQPTNTTVTITTPVCKSELLVFSATWCGACRSIKDEIDRIEASGIKVTRIDIDRQPELAAKYSVTTVPTMILTTCGSNPSKTTRTQDVADVIKWLKEARGGSSQ